MIFKHLYRKYDVWIRGNKTKHHLYLDVKFSWVELSILFLFFSFFWSLFVQTFIATNMQACIGSFPETPAIWQEGRYHQRNTVDHLCSSYKLMMTIKMANYLFEAIIYLSFNFRLQDSIALLCWKIMWKLTIYDLFNASN